MLRTTVMLEQSTTQFNLRRKYAPLKQPKSIVIVFFNTQQIGCYFRLIDKFNNFAMLEYVKSILSKVSFHKELFEKELKKAIKMLVPHEVSELKNWCYSKFGSSYEPVLNRCFA